MGLSLFSKDLTLPGQAIMEMDSDVQRVVMIAIQVIILQALEVQHAMGGVDQAISWITVMTYVHLGDAGGAHTGCQQYAHYRR